MARTDIPFTTLNLASTAAAMVLPFWFHSVSAVVAFGVMYTVCGLGLTMGYHRLFAHRAYRVPKPLEHLIALCGWLAIQRGPLFWVAMHRQHHLHTDVPGKDPHTPREGLWHVHFGWLHSRRSDVWTPASYHRFVPDLIDDPWYRWMDDERRDYAAAFGLVAASFGLGGLIGAGFRGFDVHNALCFLVWVGLLNRVALLQAFALINGVCHGVGSRPYLTSGVDRSTNNLLVALLIFGEGWHNNHHAFPASARQGLRWYQIDPAWWAIWLLWRLGLADQVRLVTPEQRSRRARCAVGATPARHGGGPTR